MPFNSVPEITEPMVDSFRIDTMVASTAGNSVCTDGSGSDVDVGSSVVDSAATELTEGIVVTVLADVVDVVDTVDVVDVVVAASVVVEWTLGTGEDVEVADTSSCNVGSVEFSVVVSESTSRVDKSMGERSSSSVDSGLSDGVTGSNETEGKSVNDSVVVTLSSRISS